MNRIYWMIGLVAVLLLSGTLAACSTTSRTATPPLDLVDPDATDETRALYANLRQLAPDHVLFGHQDDLAYGVEWWDEEGRSDVMEVTGSYPAVYGWELGDLELGAEEKPSLLVFNKVDALEQHGLISALRAEFEDAAFVSALRGINLEDLKVRLLGVIEKDFVEHIAYLPVTESKTIAYIHRVADVLAEEYMYARHGDNGAEPQAVARLHFRCARKHHRDLAPAIDRFSHLKPLPAN